MRIAMLCPITWHTPPRQYGPPWESVVSMLTKALARRGVDVSVFATRDSQTRGRLKDVCPSKCEEDRDLLPKVWDCLHISKLFEQADEFDLIHNHFGCLPLTYMNMTTTPVLTTIYRSLSPRILQVYKQYNSLAYYVAISDANRSPELDYIATIYYGIDVTQFTFCPSPGDYLLFLDHIHNGKGTAECIEIAQKTGMRLIIAGTIQDESYFERKVKPHLDDEMVTYLGSISFEKRNDLLGGAYALLNPINSGEPFGVSVIEAMACGTPVIAINRGSMPEVITDGKTGFLVACAEEMPDVVPRIKKIDRINCRRRVEERFDVKRMVDDYMRVYEQIHLQRKQEDHRPWGFYQILSDKPDHKVKRITVYPGQRLSCQRHFQRSEHLYIIKGQAVVSKNGQDIQLTSGEAIDLPVMSWHRIRNPDKENLVFIEVQTGDYFGEDDIERSEDDYGRV